MESYVIIRNKGDFLTSMVELIIFDSILEENVFLDLATVVSHISVFMFAGAVLLRLGARAPLCKAAPEKSPGAALRQVAVSCCAIQCSSVLALGRQSAG